MTPQPSTPAGASSASPTWPQLDDFEIQAELGAGGMGVVYLARQVSLNRLVAVKMLATAGTADERARFLREAEVVAELAHPNVVQIHHLGRRDDCPYFVMEYCPGGSLAARLAREPQPPRAAAETLRTLARAVHEAHRRGIVHRDLKPANVLIASDGALKVSDFGLARRLERSDLTPSGAIIGTPSYLAPEQAGQGRHVGPRADVWALGVILYEMLTGRVPFRGVTAVETILQVCAQDPVAPRRLQPTVPADLEVICLKCLEKDEARRYASAEELADDLDRFLQGHPIEARPLGRLHRAARWARRRPAQAALLAVILTAVLLLVTSSVTFVVSFGQQRDDALSKKTEADEQRGLAEGRLEVNRRLTLEAQANERRALEQLELARRQRLTGQVLRAAAYADTEPTRAVALLEDFDACPLDLRDFSWQVLYRHARRERAQLPTSTPEQMVFSPDARLLALRSGQSCTLTVRDAQGGEMVKDGSDIGACTALAFSPDGKTLAAATSGQVHLFERATWKARALRLDGPAPVALAFADDGATLATFHPEAGLRVLDVATGTVARKPALPQGVLREKGGTWLVCGDGRTFAHLVRGTHIATLWQVGQAKPLQRLNDASAFAFSPDTKVLAVAAAGTATLFDTATGQKTASLRLEEAASILAVDPRAGLLAASDSQGTTHLYDLEGRTPRLKLAEPYDPNRQASGCLALAPDGTTLAAPSLAGVTLWDLRRDWKPRVLSRPNGVQWAGFGPAGTPCGLGIEGRTIKVWDLAAGTVLRTLRAPSGQPTTGAIAPDGTTLLTVSLAGAEPAVTSVMQVWDLTTGQLRFDLPHPDPVHAWAVTPDSRTLFTYCHIPIDFLAAATGKALSGSAARLTPPNPAGVTVVRRWDLTTGRPGWVAQLASASPGAYGEIPAIRLADKVLAVTTHGGANAQHQTTVHLLDLNTGNETATVPLPPSGGTGFSPDGRWLVAVNPGNIFLSGSDGITLTLPGDGSAPVFSPDGGLYAATAAASEKGLVIGDGRLGEERMRLPGRLRPLAFSPDGRRLICQDNDGGSLVCWDVPTDAAVARWRLGPYDHPPVFLPASGLMAYVAMDSADRYSVRLVERLTGRVTRRLDVGLLGRDVHLLPVPDSRSLLVATVLNTREFTYETIVSLWDVPTGKKTLERRLPGPIAGTPVWLSEREELLLTVIDLNQNQSRSLRRFDLRTGRDATLHAGKRGEDVFACPDGEHVLVYQRKSEAVRVLDAGRQQVAEWRGFTVFSDRLAFSPDGRLLASYQTGEIDKAGVVKTGQVKLWDVATGQLHHEFTGPSAGPALLFSADGRYFVTGTDAGGVRILDVKAGKETAAPWLPARAGAPVAVAPDGRELLTAGGDRYVTLWRRPN